MTLLLAGCAGGAADSTDSASPASAVTQPSQSAVQASTISPAEAHRRADAAVDALVAGFWNGSGFSTKPGGSDAGQYWLNAQALDAVLDGIERTGGAGGSWSDVARAFIAAQDARGWHSDYFDDENWMALALLRAADILGDPNLVAISEALLDDIIAGGTDASCCGTQPGGLWWDRFHTQKATASNAGPVITAARLYQRSHDPKRLDFARQLFAYWLAQMVDPTTGQVVDHIGSNGDKVWWRFTYNEGAMIGAALALHDATGDASYLDAARRIGGFMMTSETTQSAAGAILTDGSACDGDCEQFKGIGQRYLAALASSDPAGGWGGLVARNGDGIWTLDRDASNDEFGADWAGPPRPATVGSQSSAAMGLDRAARARGPYTR